MPRPTACLALVATVAGLAGVCAPPPRARAAAAAAPPAADAALADRLAHVEAEAFTLNLVLFAASAAADTAERARLHPLLLGYEPDAAVEGRMPWRRALAARAAAWPPSARRRMLTFVLDHPAAVTHLNALALQMVGPAPDFRPIGDEVDPRALPPHLAHLWAGRAELAALLAEAWGPLGGSAMWRELAPRWRAARIDPTTVAALEGRMATFLGLPATRAAPEVVHNLMMPANAAVTSVFPDGHVQMVVGPTPSPRGDAALLAHELAHPLMQAALEDGPRLRRALAASACAFTAAKAAGESRTLTTMVYTTWETYFTEALIRGAVDDLFPGATASERPLVLEHPLGAALARAHAGGRGGARMLTDLLAGPATEFCAHPPAAGRAGPTTTRLGPR